MYTYLGILGKCVQSMDAGHVHPLILPNVGGSRAWIFVMDGTMQFDRENGSMLKNDDDKVRVWI